MVTLPTNGEGMRFSSLLVTGKLAHSMKKNNTAFLYNSTYKGDIWIDKNLNMKGKTTKPRKI